MTPKTLRRLAGTLLVGLAMWAAAPTSPRAAQAGPPVILIGLDGAEERVLEQFWSKGGMPALANLKDRGSYSQLRTDYNARSPVVWTTVATGHTKETHGITDFVSASASKQVPVASTDRKVRALWNLVSESGGVVDVLGWWASFPAETVNGIVITDRAHKLTEANVASPPAVAERLPTWAEKAEAGYGEWFPGDEWAAGMDRLVTWTAVRELNAGRPDLVMAYLHRIDLVSHHFWKYFEPAKYPSVASSGDPVEEALFFDGYRVTDQAVGAILDAAPRDATVFVVSDHGFQGIEEYTKIRYNLGRSLETLGLLKHAFKRQVDWAQTRLYVYNSPDMRDRKMLRVNLQGRDPDGVVPPSQKAAVIAEATEKLSAITFAESGRPAFRIEQPRAKEDCDLVVVVNQEGAGRELLYEGETLPLTILEVKAHSGGHGNNTPGVFFAAGPNIQRGAALRDPSIFDITPTVLHAMGMPVGEDMAGRVLTEVFDPGWLEQHPVKTIPTWETGERQGQTTESDADEEMLEELRALGYIE